MIIEGNRPQNSLLEAADGLKSYKTNTHPTFSFLLVCATCLNSFQKISVVHRAVDTSGVVIQAARNPSRKRRPDQLEASLVWETISLIVWLLHDGAISFQAFAPI